MRETRVTTSVLARMTAAMLGQRGKTQRSPDSPRLDGRFALVTGATGGIGLETARGLLDRCAHVILAARDLDRARSLPAAGINAIWSVKRTSALSRNSLS